MPVFNQYSETDFINQLTEQLSRQDNWKVEKEPNGGAMIFFSWSPFPAFLPC